MGHLPEGVVKLTGALCCNTTGGIAATIYFCFSTANEAFHDDEWGSASSAPPLMAFYHIGSVGEVLPAPLASGRFCGDRFAK